MPSDDDDERRRLVSVPLVAPGACYASYCYFVLQALLVATLISSAVGKSVAFSEPLDYVIHFTNWSWTFQIIFYTVTLVSYVPACVDCATVFVAFAFLPLVATVTSVAVLVWILLGTDDEGFLSMVFENIHPGYVMIGNDLVHVLPLMFILIWALARAPLVYYALYWLFTSTPARTNDRCRFVLVLWQAWSFFLLVAIYFATLAAIGTTVNDVYGTELNVGAGLGVAAAVSLLIVGSTLFLCARNYGVCRRRSLRAEVELRRRVITTDFEDELVRRWQASVAVAATRPQPRSR